MIVGADPKKPVYCVRCGKAITSGSVKLEPGVGVVCYPPCLSPEIRTIIGDENYDYFCTCDDPANCRAIHSHRKPKE